jgi:hypothetical protein
MSINDKINQVKNLQRQLASVQNSLILDIEAEQRKSPLNQRIDTLTYQLNYAKREIEALHEKFGKPFCPHCGGGILECDGIQTMGPDPFAEEIHGDSTNYLMCEGARHNSAMDI